MAIRVLGIHDGHGASAALLEDGRLVAAIQEERLTGIKNQGGIPAHAIREVLEQAGLSLSDIDFFALDGTYMVHSHHDRDAILRYYARAISRGGGLDRRARHLLKKTPLVDNFYKAMMQQSRLKALEAIGIPSSKTVPIEHHTAHGSCAYYGWGRYDEDILVLTCDGTGDRLSGSVSVGRGGKMERIAAIAEESSIGQVYTLVTFLMGMVPLEHEYKVMGLAPYAQADQKHVDRLCQKFASMFELDPREPLVWRRRKGVPSTFSSASLLQKLMRRERFDWIAAGLQKFIEEFVCAWVRQCVEHTGIRRVALAGGVFMNVKLNQRILSMPEVEELFVYPSCGDETTSMGAAYWVYANQNASPPRCVEPLNHLYLARGFTDEDVERAIGAYPANGFKHHYEEDIEHTVAELLASGEVVARAKGPMEFGARALGNRSILANPGDPAVLRTINDMIKQRDFWMPFASSVLAERADDYYIKPKPMSAPYMIVTFDSRPEKTRCYVAATHPYDGTTRPQEVFREWNPDYYRLIEGYQSLTGEGIVLNTSFNLHGFPVVYTPHDALDVTVRSGLKYAAIGNFLISKNGK
ncbi:MAG: carbamoyltransferase [Chloroflexi bacterium]|nr:carbamoyltransferase [Chloroflexota bacterium]